MSNLPLPRFGLFNTEARVVHSDRVGQDFEIGIWFPFSYASSDRRYPVLYVPDGEFVFAAAAGLMPTLMGNGEVPEMIMVGIAYHGISSWQEFGALRERDLLPPELHHPPLDSRLDRMTDFYIHELIPLIETTYRADPHERALYGFSSGGFFAARMLLTQTGLFRRCAAASCTWPGADDYLLKCAIQSDAQPLHPPADLYLAVGGQDSEQIPGFDRLCATLQNREDANLRFTSELFAGEGHSAAVIANSFLSGLKSVFKA